MSHKFHRKKCFMLKQIITFDTILKLLTCMKIQIIVMVLIKCENLKLGNQGLLLDDKSKLVRCIHLENFCPFKE